jgi:diaminopropionate ammonia-lyase
MAHETRIHFRLNPAARRRGASGTDTGGFSPEAARAALAYHRSLPGYEPTPLISLAHKAADLGIARILIKDESRRFSLKAFKVLGASYALADAMIRRLGSMPGSLSFDFFRRPAVRRALKHETVVTATDGNHGRAVAWTAERIGCRAVVYMPAGSSQARVENIRAHGAETLVIEGNYDEAVRRAAGRAGREGWLLIQDSSWPGYEEIPFRIMQGYLTLMTEIEDQLRGRRPTHVFVQCGVGSFAASVQAYLAARFGRKRPVLTVVEPLNAACHFKSMCEGRGGPEKVGGDLRTIMAGLACGEPSILAWRILRDYADAFTAVSDDLTVNGMRALARPAGSDPPVISGESGAVTLGLLAALMTEGRYETIRQDLKMDKNSSVLLFSTEGDTDPAGYRACLENGKC